MRIARASSCDANSSNNAGSASDISGLMEAMVRVRSSVPYFCLTILGNCGCKSRNQVTTTTLTMDGDNSSSSVGSVL